MSLPTPHDASLEVSAASESFVSSSSRATGYPRHRPSARERARARLGSMTVLRLHNVVGTMQSDSSSLVLPPLQSTFASNPAPAFGSGLYLPRFFSLFAASPEPSGNHEDPTPRYVPSSGFLNLSTICSGPGLTGDVPGTTSRVYAAPPEVHKSEAKRS